LEKAPHLARTALCLHLTNILKQSKDFETSVDSCFLAKLTFVN